MCIKGNIVFPLDTTIINTPPTECGVYVATIKGSSNPLLKPKYCRPDGILFEQDSLEILKHVNSESIDLIFADPPYNIRKANWDKFESQETYIDWSMQWIREASRILKPTGSLYICGFTEILADLKHPAMKYFKKCKWLIWYYKNKANLSNDWGRSHESLLHLRKTNKFKLNVDPIRIPYNAHTLKYPSHPQAESSQYSGSSKKYSSWTPNPLGAKPKDVIEIPTTCNGMGEKTKHPTQKPEELLRKIVLSSSNEGDIVLDPFSGSGTTATVCRQLNRKWIGIELTPEYNQWAIERIDNVVNHPESYWINLDRANAERRNSLK